MGMFLWVGGLTFLHVLLYYYFVEALEPRVTTMSCEERSAALASSNRVFSVLQDILCVFYKIFSVSFTIFWCCC